MASRDNRTASRLLAAALSFMAILMILAAPATAADRKDVPPLPDGLVEMALGSPEAPVTMVEYASLTCSHCQEFALHRRLELKEKYIDTGKVRLLYRDYPLDGLALRASMLSRCAGPDHFFDYVHAYFAKRNEWLAGDPTEGLKDVARGEGMSDTDIEACLADEDLSKMIVAGMQSGKEALGFSSTPTFLIGGRVVSGTLPMQMYEALIDTALIEAGAKER